ncbi:hypothetical protein [Niallia taxi]|uniref:hypothetical protein n=1 Tax=Niallia taxi TaxID=2499688 RepID=UPI0015F747EC|nr:hypothetical protein [Niallia taxi]
MIKNCIYCDKKIDKPYPTKKYCSASCKTMFLRAKNNPKQLIKRICEKCSDEYSGPASSRFCSAECRNSFAKICGYCGKEFAGHYNARYCSMTCKDAYKIRKPTGTYKVCIVCDTKYQVTYGKKKVKKQVCSVPCANIAASSKSGRYISLEEIVEFIKNSSEQPPVNVVADSLNTSMTTILSRAKDKYGSYRDMIIAVRGTYLNTNDEQSLTANALFQMIDEIYGLIGIREKTFDDLVNPVTGWKLRYDYYLPEASLLIEYHGVQHYKEVDFFDGNPGQSFRARKARDTLKVKYVKNNNQLNLVIFNYLDKITEDTIRKKLDKYLKQTIPRGATS